MCAAPRSIAMFVTGLDIGGVDGGAESSGIELARYLHATGDRVTLYAFWRADSATETAWLARLEAEGLPVGFLTPAGARRNSGNARAGLAAIHDLLARERFDIAHAHHEGAALGLAQARLVGARPVVLRTAHIPLDLQWGFGVPARVLRALVSGALLPAVLDREVVVAPWYAREHDARLLARILGLRCAMIYNARSVAVEAPRLRTPGSTVTIGMAGRLVSQKAPATLLDALPAVRARLTGVPVRTVFVGDGPLRADLEARAQALGVRDAVDFLGQRDDVREQMRGWDVFALPSIWEGLPNVLIEAISYGVPVVASGIPGIDDVVTNGESAWLVRPNDPGALADALCDAIESPDRSYAMAVRAQTNLPRFSLAHVAGEYRALYDALLARNARRAAAK
jgi:glycosyltransferase involved in cell wall biosynthesis